MATVSMLLSILLPKAETVTVALVRGRPSAVLNRNPFPRSSDESVAKLPHIPPGAITLTVVIVALT